MANLPIQPAAAGSAVAYAAAAAGGDTITVGATRATLLIRNAAAATVTVTLPGVQRCSQNGLHDTVVAAAVGDSEVLVPQQSLNNLGVAAVNYSAVASVTVAVVA